MKDSIPHSNSNKKQWKITIFIFEREGVQKKEKVRMTF